MPKIVQNEYTKAYNKEHYKNVSIKITPEEAEEIDRIAKQTGQSKARLIVNAVREYAQSLTAAGTAPEKISPETLTGAEETPTETQAETPEEDQQGKPQDKPQDAHSKPQDASKQGKTDITSKATKEPTENAQSRTEVSPEQIPLDEFEQAVLNAYRKAYKQARADIKAQQQAQAIARTFKGIPKRTSRTKIQARRRPKAYKG